MAHRKNSELLADPRAAFLTGIEKQRLFVLRALLSPRSCPNCAHHPLSFFDAAGISVDDMDLHREGASDRALTCPNCRRGLQYTLPLVGDWFFRLVPQDHLWKLTNDAGENLGTWEASNPTAAIDRAWNTIPASKRINVKAERVAS